MFVRFLAAAAFVAVVAAVDHSLFRTCAESDFCSTLRYQNASYQYELDVDSINVTDYFFTAAITNGEDYLTLQITTIQGGIIRVTIDELEPRYQLDSVLQSTVDNLDEIIEYTIGDTINITLREHVVVVNPSPFSIQFLHFGAHYLVGLNTDGRLDYHTDEDQAFAFNVQFPAAIRAYGLPEHADHVSLRSTVNTDEPVDPYRLYNLDVPGYEVNSTMALYGSVPVLYGHGELTSGVFLHNAAEQWVDIDRNLNGVSAYFMVESGAFDLFVLLGASPQEAVQQYANVTGTADVPPLWALGYHQSRWNYWTQEEVVDVIANFDISNFSLDVVWLDIEYTDGYKYFTWNPSNFSDPVVMQNTVASTYRKVVPIIDPHIKIDDDYFVYNEALAADYFVRDSNGSVFEGECWPGLSHWVDFLNPNASIYWADLFSYSRFNDTTSTIAGIWNDMNEPSVFDDSLEKTFPKDNVHYGGVIHRDVHNAYGFLQTRATHHGLIQRENPPQRPFVLSRSHFAGSQRYTAIWTGDNTANWDHLAVSYSMCLSEALAGISFCGADVGGFSGTPDPELLIRWYQAGAWLPFYRVHSAPDTDRREPYAFDEDVQAIVRNALRQRYMHLPLWYTVFYEHYRFGTPVIRPLFYEYPNDMQVVDIEDQIAIGTSIMVRAVTQPNVTSVRVYFPGGAGQFWYDIDTPLIYPGVGYLNANVTIDRIPVFHRGGAIVAKKFISRRSSEEMHDDHHTVYIFLNANQEARGTIYLDDFKTFDYKNGTYNYYEFIYQNDTISISAIDPLQYPDGELRVDNYLLYRAPTLHDFRDPVPVEPSVFTHAADGKRIRDIRYSATEPTIIKL